MKQVKYLTIIILSFILFFSCGKIEKLPPEPSISFMSFEVFDTTDILENIVKGGRLYFKFQDGDGDLGLPAPGLVGGQDTTNLFFILKRKAGSVFDTVPKNDPIRPSDYRIPYMDRQGQNKILKGNIKITFLYLFSSPTDTIKYFFNIKDRAGNISNTDSTCVIVLGKNGICNR
jgi:hypothetical protein